MINIKNFTKRMLIIKKENDRLIFIDKNIKKNLKTNGRGQGSNSIIEKQVLKPDLTRPIPWWAYTCNKLIRIFNSNKSIIPDEDGFYLIVISERIKYINFEYDIPNADFKILEENDIKIGVPTKLENDSKNIITIPNYFLLMDTYENFDKSFIEYNWDIKINDLIYMGSLNCEFRKNIINNLRADGLNQLFTRDNNLSLSSNGNHSISHFNEHSKYKFILDLPTDHEFNYDYSWTLFKKFYFKSLVFHIELPEKHYTYFNENFENGKDWIICKDVNDFKIKYNYYINHQSEAKEIAENGYNKMISIHQNIHNEYRKYLEKCKNKIENWKYFNTLDSE
jgi:hypothetical protein